MDTSIQPPDNGDWCALTTTDLPIAAVYEWCVLPTCGAIVVFSGTVRDHAVDSDGAVRDGVTHLTYEAYEEHVEPRLHAIAAEARNRWLGLGRLVLLHRVGQLGLGDSSVVCAASAAHRGEAFEAARFLIDALKDSAPIWKRESWEDGDSWGTGSRVIRDVAGN